MFVLRDPGGTNQFLQLGDFFLELFPLSTDAEHWKKRFQLLEFIH